MSRLRPTIEALSAYEPGEQPSPGSSVIKLNTNENPYPPSPRTGDALRAIAEEHLRRYPAPYADEFRLAAAEVLGTVPERVLVGNGSDDLLTMLMRAVTDPTRSVAYPVPTYVLYRTLAGIQPAPVREIPFDEDYTLPVDRLVAADAALTIVANPNSPSGTAAPPGALEELARRVSGVLVIDEAYVEFASGHALELTDRFEHVVVLRTLSKSHALAGLRLGYAVAHPTLIRGLAKVKDSYNVDAIASRVGAAAIRDTAYTREIVRRVCTTRARLAAIFSRLGCRVWPSEANFLLVRPPDGRARELYLELKRHGILVRHFDTPGLSETIRVTVGTEAQTTRLEEILTSLMPASAAAGRRPDARG